MSDAHNDLWDGPRLFDVPRMARKAKASRKAKADYEDALKVEEDLREKVNAMRRQLSAASRRRYDLGKKP